MIVLTDVASYKLRTTSVLSAVYHVDYPVTYHEFRYSAAECGRFIQLRPIYECGGRIRLSARSVTPRKSRGVVAMGAAHRCYRPERRPLRPVNASYRRGLLFRNKGNILIKE
ncbi:hypothetical protein EVAR_9091_1 [Eumeta japonica]|uniref:Uncharacterized protein n=1 Tax=Eumeta variegata TaxID=151549 RepID=A0A4C1TW54_EUMVA|nr:hypothetical protein EVAR_9091_1 [Eumeta japonica]